MRTRDNCRKVARWALAAFLFAGAAFCAVGENEKCPVSANVRGHENIEWSISYAYGLTDATRDLPRVLLIGDSICNGYQEGVRERLKGKMNVTYWISSYCATSPAYLPLLSIYLDEAKYDVIHFNNGLHSLETPTDAWAKGFKAALELVRKKQPDAKIVWCSSTPLANDVKTAKCRELNAAAARVIAELGGIATDDLFALCDPLDRATNWSDEYHFRPEAKAKQADQVAASVSIVPARPAPSPALAARLAEGPEIYGIVHWGLNTYTDKEWGFGDEDPAMLNPDKFDADQIVGACKVGGIGGLIVVAKHHDGFCLWPTKTTEHNITKSPFGRDYIKEMEQACRRAGLKFGVYVSPWDRNNAAYGTEKYVTDVFQKQIRELLSGDYGEIFEMWFDGANGGDGYYGGAREKRKIPSGYYRYDTETFAMVRRLQPKVCIFNEMDEADFRYGGNEKGLIDPDSRSTGGHYDGIWDNYKVWANTGIVGGSTFHPIEADFPLRRGWFYHEKERGTTKSTAYLTKLYLSSVGNAATMNIGIAPDKSGRLDTDDVRALAGFGIMRNALFAHEAKDGEPFNVVVMREDVSNGEQVDEWELVADGKAVLRGKSIGWKRIRVLEMPCAAKNVDLKIMKDGGALKGVSFKLYNADPELVKTILSATGDDRETDTAKWMTGKGKAVNED